MKRDDDLIRELLLQFEEAAAWEHEMPGSFIGFSEEDSRRRYHVLLLIDEGLLVEADKDLVRLTASGHDFLDAVRAETAWKRAKDGAASVGGVTLGVLKDIAVAYMKKEVSARLGIDL